MKPLVEFLSESMDRDIIPGAIVNAVKKAMKDGYIEFSEGGKKIKFGVSRENIRDIIDDIDCNDEMLERLIHKFEADGLKFKFEKDEEWRKEGYEDLSEW